MSVTLKEQQDGSYEWVPGTFTSADLDAANAANQAGTFDTWLAEQTVLPYVAP